MPVILDALVIGSGALGCATAFYLTEAGVRRVGVVDRGPLVSGMTRRNAGLVHTHHSDETTIRLALESLGIYRRWSALIGGSCGFLETGTVVTMESQEGADSLLSRVTMQRRLGAETQILDAADLPRLFPRASFRSTSAVAFEPASGYVDPVLASQGFARRSREKGAKFDTGTLVRQIGVQRGRVTETVTNTGVYQSPIVIITAGAGARALLAPLGVSLDLRGTRGAIGFLEQPPSLYGGHPTIVDLDSASFLRPHAFHLSAAGIPTGSFRAKDLESWDGAVSDDDMHSLSELAVRMVPLLQGASLKRTHSIVYDEMADGFAVLGSVPGASGLYIAAGFGQYSVATAPAVGRVLARLVTDGISDLDIQGFRIERPSITHLTEAS